ncbi:hypothetical protein ACOMHN_024271 [Nucella lapillus]
MFFREKPVDVDPVMKILISGNERVSKTTVTEDPGYDYDYAVTPQGKLLDVVVARWTSGNCRHTVYGDGGTHAPLLPASSLPRDGPACKATDGGVRKWTTHVVYLTLRPFAARAAHLEAICCTRRHY